MSCTFDLSGLAPAHCVDAAPATKKPAPAWTGGALFTEVRQSGDTPSSALVDAADRRPSLALYLLLKYNKSLKGRECTRVLNVVTRFLYTLAMGLLVGIAVYALFFHRSLVDFSSMDWFGWFTWVLLCLTEALLFLARGLARWTFVGERAHLLGDRGRRCDALWGMIVHRDAYGAWWQALIVIALQIGVSGFAMAGLLVVVLQMLADDGDRAVLAPLWSSAFAFSVFALCLTSLLDAVRVREIDAFGGFNMALELTAARTLVMTIVVPIVALAFVVYANICCEGDVLL